MIEERDLWGRDRARAEDRSDEILSRLIVGDAIGSKQGGLSGGRELEEELLDELEELERVLSRGTTGTARGSVREQ